MLQAVDRDHEVEPRRPRLLVGHLDEVSDMDLRATDGQGLRIHANRVVPVSSEPIQESAFAAANLEHVESLPGWDQRDGSACTSAQTKSVGAWIAAVVRRPSPRTRQREVATDVPAPGATPQQAGRVELPSEVRAPARLALGCDADIGRAHGVPPGPSSIVRSSSTTPTTMQARAAAANQAGHGVSTTSAGVI